MRFSLKTQLGRLRLLGYLEGVSLLILLFVAMPVKYFGKDPSLVKTLGPVHGMLFLLFIFGALSAGVEYQWKFRQTTWKLLVACFIPFGTFYIDRQILRNVRAKS